MGKTKAHKRYRLPPTEEYPKGEIVPGVTTIISNQLAWNKNTLIAWARREALAGNDPDKIRDEAADSGTCTHYLIECHIKGMEPDLKDFTRAQIDKAEVGFRAFEEWEKDQDLFYQYIEFPVISLIYRYGGTIDVVAEPKGNNWYWLIDIKTSKGIWPEHKIQVAAYGQAFFEQTGELIDEYHILQLNKDDGSFQHHKLSQKQLDKAYRVFLLCRQLYDLQKKF